MKHQYRLKAIEKQLSKKKFTCSVLPYSSVPLERAKIMAHVDADTSVWHFSSETPQTYKEIFLDSE